VDDLREVGLVPDDQNALIGGGGAHERKRLVGVEAAGERLVLDGLDPERLAGQPRRVACADLRAGERDVDLDLQRRQRLAGGAGLGAPAIGEPALDIGARVMRLGLAVPQEPELLRHSARRLLGDAHPV
jgi:hypothetical protein